MRLHLPEHHSVVLLLVIVYHHSLLFAISGMTLSYSSSLSLSTLLFDAWCFFRLVIVCSYDPP